jgi:hypothetical protein
MRISGRAVALLALLALTTTACGGAASTSSSSAAANGVLPSAPATTATASPASSASAVAPGLQSFTFPAGIDVEFQTPLPPSGAKRDAVIGYENYINSLWYAVSTHGTSTAYKQHVSGNALTFAQAIIKQFKQYNLHLSGKIVYYDISVPHVYFNAAAVVQACVNASGMDRVKQSGRSLGTIFGSGYDHYQEQVADGKQKSSPAWLVSHTQNVPATSGGSAGMCM